MTPTHRITDVGMTNVEPLAGKQTAAMRKARGIVVLACLLCCPLFKHDLNLTYEKNLVASTIKYVGMDLLFARLLAIEPATGSFTGNRRVLDHGPLHAWRNLV